MCKRGQVLLTAIAIGYKIMSIKGFSGKYNSPSGDKMKRWNKHIFIHSRFIVFHE